MMASPKKSPPWQDIRRVLSAKTKTELLNLVRDLYALNPENKGFIQAQALTPKTSPRRKVVVKDVRRGKTFEVVLKGKTSEVVPRSNTSQIAPKIRRLAQVAAELRAGGSFNITRLTTLKSLCEDSKAAAQFALYLATQTYQNMQAQKCPSHLDPETWDTYKELVAKSLERMEIYVKEPSEQATRALWSVQAEVRGVQNTYKQHQWGPVRIIQSSEVLLVEYALSCLLQPHASTDWGYHIAREYAERSNSRYGTGLIPESAPMIEDIADFWCQFHLGQPLQAWLGAS